MACIKLKTNLNKLWINLWRIVFSKLKFVTCYTKRKPYSQFRRKLSYPSGMTVYIVVVYSILNYYFLDCWILNDFKYIWVCAGKITLWFERQINASSKTTFFGRVRKFILNFCNNRKYDKRIISMRIFNNISHETCACNDFIKYHKSYEVVIMILW